MLAPKTNVVPFAGWEKLPNADISLASAIPPPFAPKRFTHATIRLMMSFAVNVAVDWLLTVLQFNVRCDDCENVSGEVANNRRNVNAHFQGLLSMNLTSTGEIRLRSTYTVKREFLR